MSATTRLFLAVEIDDPVRERAAAIARAAAPRLAPAVSVRWIAPENLHLTLWFLGSLQAGRVSDVVTSLQRSFDGPAFTLHLAGLGAFPGDRAPRVIWLGVREGQEAMARLHGDIARRLRPVGFEPERRRFSPHLTLGRVKSVHASLDPSWRAQPADAGRCGVTGVTLFQSHLGPKGAAYEPLLRVPLV